MKVVNLIFLMFFYCNFLFAQKAKIVLKETYTVFENDKWQKKISTNPFDMNLIFNREKVKIVGTSIQNYYIDDFIKENKIGKVIVKSFNAHDDMNNDVVLFFTNEPPSDFYIFSVLIGNNRFDYEFEDK